MDWGLQWTITTHARASRKGRGGRNGRQGENMDWGPRGPLRHTHEPRAKDAEDAMGYPSVRFGQPIDQSFDAILKMFLAEVDQVSEAQV
jgi:hypothetical protein